MQAFKAAFEAGTSSITPAAQGLYLSLIAIDFTWAMCKAALESGANYPKILVEKTMRYAIFGYFISNYDHVFHSIVNSLITVGLTAGGGSLSPGSFADPSWLIDKGLSTVEPIEKFLSQTSNFAPNMIAALLLALVVYLFIVAAFFIMAIQVFITYLEVYIVGTLAVIFLGCGVNKHTTFLAEKSIGAVLSFAIKLMTLAFIISVATPLMNSIVIPDTPNNSTYLKLLSCVAAIAFLCWQAPSLAAGLMAGSPSLSAGGIAGAVMATGAAAIGGAMAAAGAARMGGQALEAMNGLGQATEGAEATMQAANAASSGVGGVSSSLLNTGDFGLGQTGSGPSGNNGGSGISPSNVAERYSPSSNATSSEAGSAAGSTANSPPGDSASPVASSSDSATNASSNISGSSSDNASTSSSASNVKEATSSDVTGSTNTATSTGGQSSDSGSTISAESVAERTAIDTGAAINGQDVADATTGDQPATTDEKSEEKAPTMSAASVAGRIALANNAIPPESSPQGGVGATIHNDE